MRKIVSVFLLVLMAVSLAYAGLSEDYQALQQQFMRKRMNIRSRADMDKLMAERTAALENLLVKYKGKKLAGNEKILMAEILISVNRMAPAWDILKAITKPDDVEKYNALCTRALFGLGKDALASKYLEKLNHEGKYYGMLCFGRAMSLKKKGEINRALPYLKQVIKVVTLRDAYRVFAIHTLVDYDESAGRHPEAMKLLSEFAKDNTLSARSRLDLANTQKAMAMIGKKAFNFQDIVRRFNGRAPVLYKEKGKVLVLEFFAPWCAPCRNEMKALSRLFLEKRDKGLDVIGITRLYGFFADGKVNEQNITAKKEAFLIAEFVKSMKLSYPMVLIGKDDSYSDYGVTGLPHVVLVDKKGVIRRVFTGMYQEKDFQKAVQALLQEKLK
ncbi:MAG: TlpA family protein disulfide reductase [Acidobacteria bacterium]|nr:TlpA family protein disulfide reductase [Acidobacteriota bacterium]